MTENEKEIYFDGEKPEDTNYEVIEIFQPRLREMSGTQEEAETGKFTRVRKSVEFSSHGEDFKLEMKPNTKLLAPYVRFHLTLPWPVSISGDDSQEILLWRSGEIRKRGRLSRKILIWFDCNILSLNLFLLLVISKSLLKEEMCHYLHQDGETVAAFDLCDPDNLHGLVIQNNRRYEVIPLNSRLKRMLDLWKNGTKYVLELLLRYNIGKYVAG